MRHSLQKGMGWTFHLAFRIVSLQANAAFPAEGNGLDIFRIVSLQANAAFPAEGNGLDISRAPGL